MKRWIKYSMTIFLEDGSREYVKGTFLGDESLLKNGNTHICSLARELSYGWHDKHLITQDGQLVTDSYYHEHIGEHFDDYVIKAVRVRVNSVDGKKVNLTIERY